MGRFTQRLSKNTHCCLCPRHNVTSENTRVHGPRRPGSRWGDAAPPIGQSHRPPPGAPWRPPPRLLRKFFPRKMITGSNGLARLFSRDRADTNRRVPRVVCSLAGQGRPGTAARENKNDARTVGVAAGVSPRRGCRCRRTWCTRRGPRGLPGGLLSK